MDENTSTAPDFQGALAAEFGLDPPAESTTSTDSTPPADTKAEPETPPAAEAQVPPTEVETPPAGEPAKPQGGEEPVPPTDPEAPKFMTKDDVVDAMRQYNQETAGRLDQVSSASKEIIGTLYPEGIDSNIYDTNGNVIKTAQDIVDRGLVNERTGEPFSYEEAASFMLEAGQKMTKNVEELNNWAEKVAEENINLMEGNKRVMDKWGETLKALPKETVEALAEKYITKLLKFDKTNSYITEMAMTPEEFYDTALSPYSQLSQSIASQKQADEAAKTQAATTEQSERNGIPPQRGQSDVRANTGDPMLDALVDELKKG